MPRPRRKIPCFLDTRKDQRRSIKPHSGDGFEPFVVLRMIVSKMKCWIFFSNGHIQSRNNLTLMCWQCGFPELLSYSKTPKFLLFCVCDLAFPCFFSILVLYILFLTEVL